MDETKALKIAYARACGLKNAVPRSNTVPGLANDLNQIVDMIVPIVGAEANSFYIRQPDMWSGGGSDTTYCYAEVLQGRLSQLISFLEYACNINNNIMEIGSLFNSIKDNDLKNRCADLLSAPGNFDRVINQATLVLEDRIRTKSGIDKPPAGVPLVNTALNPDLTKTVIKVSENQEEHEGIWS